MSVPTRARGSERRGRSQHWDPQPSAYPCSKTLLTSGVGSSSKLSSYKVKESWKNLRLHCSWKYVVTACIQLGFFDG